MNRNRLKNEQGELWLRVLVYKTRRGLQIIRNVEIFNKIDWRKKHLRSILQNYANAPYLDDYLPSIEKIYETHHQKLVALNLEIIRFFWQVLALKTPLLLQSDLGISDKGPDLIINICQHLHADTYLTFPMVEKYLYLDKMARRCIRVTFANFHPPVYPQLWGNFIQNLSALDLLLNCGPRSREIISKS